MHVDTIECQTTAEGIKYTSNTINTVNTITYSQTRLLFHQKVVA